MLSTSGKASTKQRPVAGFIAECLGVLFLIGMLLFGPSVGDRAPRTGRPYGQIAIVIYYLAGIVITLWMIRSLVRRLKRYGFLWTSAAKRQEFAFERDHRLWFGPFRCEPNERIRFMTRVLESPEELVPLEMELVLSTGRNEPNPSALHRTNVEIAPDADPRAEVTFPAVNTEHEILLGVTARFRQPGVARLQIRAGKVRVL